jgi:hypothetical protein
MMKLTNLGVAALCGVVMTALTATPASSAIYDVVQLRGYGGVYAGGDQYADLFQDQTGVPLELRRQCFRPMVSEALLLAAVYRSSLGTTASLDWVQAILASYVLDADSNYVDPSFAKALLTVFSLTTTPAVPEPSTWAMMILGFAGLVFMAYRRKTAIWKPSAAGAGRCVIPTPGFFCAPPVTERVVPLQAFVNPAYFFGRMASAVPWMKAAILVTSSSESLPVKSGMPRSMNGPLNTMGNGLGARIAEVLDVAAAVDARHAMTEDAVGDVEQRARTDVVGLVLHALHQHPPIHLGEGRRLGVAADREGERRARHVDVGGANRQAIDAAPADRDGHILHAVDHVSRRSGHHAGSCRRLPQLVTGLGVIGDEAAVGGTLEHEVAGRRQRAAVPGRGIVLLPHLLLLDRIPGDQAAERLALRRLHIDRVAEVPTGAALGFALGSGMR